MARRRRAQTRKIDADPIYGSVVISKFINKLMYDGKKSKAENIFYKAMDLVKEKTGKDGLEAFNEAIENIKPRVEVKSRRVGGSTYQVPVDVRPDRQNSLAFTWLIDASRKRGGRSMIERLVSSGLRVGALRVPLFWIRNFPDLAFSVSSAASALSI